MENENLTKCTHCGAEHAENEMKETHDGDFVCMTCINAGHYRYCDETETYYPEDEIYSAYDTDGNEVSIAYNQVTNYATCEVSGEIHHEDNMITAHNQRRREIQICRDTYENGNFFRCEDCNEVHHNDNEYNFNDNSICAGCFEDNYSSCSECGENYYLNDGRNCSCDEEEEENSNLIESYSFRPVPNFRGRGTTKMPFIGFENEIETKQGLKTENAELCFEKLTSSEIYLKEDSSIDHGFEIVSHPATLAEHKKINYSDLFKALSKTGAKSHDTKTCGLHFHIDKREMKTDHKIRFGAFFSINKEIMQVLARRKADRWAKFKDKNFESMGAFCRSDERYEAVNWAPAHTVEVRIFKGTLKYETFMASMELCQAVYSFTLNDSSFKNVKLEMPELWPKFIKFINSKFQAKKFPYLLNYLNEKSEKIEAVLEIESARIKAETKFNTMMNNTDESDVETISA